MSIGSRDEIRRLAEKRAKEYGGHIYGKNEHGGTATLYVSKIPFELIDRALTEDVPDKGSAMRFHRPENEARKQNALAKAALVAPLAGIAGAFAATVAKKEKTDEK